MGKAPARKRTKFAEDDHKLKKRTSYLDEQNITYIDYKDADLLKRYMSDRAKIRSRRISGNTSQQQKLIARAIKNAREMGLIAYTSSVTTQRKGGRGRRDEEYVEKPAPSSEPTQSLEEAVETVENVTVVEVSAEVEVAEETK